MVQALNPPNPKATLTLADFLEMPETKPASEFIDGEIIQKPMPQGKHSAVQSEFVPAVNGTLKPSKIARAFAELRCTFGGRSIVPDISVFKLDRIPRDPDGSIANDFEIAPDWIVEILSPDQRHTRIVKNIMHCFEHGTLMGWLIDPDECTIFVYHPDRTVDLFDEPDTQLPIPNFAQSLTLTVGEIFSWLTK